jgi:excisionase family DNA binding protein
MEKEDREPLVYSPNEARKLLKISRGLIYEAINTGRIPSIRIGRRILIPRSGLEKLLNEGSDLKFRKESDKDQKL